MSGGMISGFELIEKLGEGGMGTVFKANQLSLDRMVALKILPPELSQDSEEIGRFKLEARSAAKLHHPGIVQVYETGGAHGVFYIVMEFVDGYTVGEWIRRDDKLTEADTLFVADNIAKALQYAWDKHNIIHRDIKPDNILIDNDGSVKLADLGLAKIVGSADAALAVDDMCTPHYCSPEQAAAEKISDPSSDIYSLGATMYHMVTGQLPFDNPDDPLAPLEGHANEFLPDPRKFNSKLSTKFVLLLAKMMAKETDDRYKSWAELLTDIGRVNTGKVLSKPIDQKIYSTLKIDPNKAAVRSTRIVTQGKSGTGSQSRVRRKQQTKRQKSNPILLGVLCTLLLAGICIAVYVGGEGDRQAAAQQAQANLNAEAELQRINAFSSRNRDQQNVVIQDLKTAMKNHKHSDQGPALARALAEAERKRDRSTRNILAELKKKAEVQISLRNIDDAMAVYTGYEGPYAPDTEEERSAAANRIRKAHRPSTQTAPTVAGPSLNKGPTGPAPTSLAPDLLKFNEVYVTRVKSIEAEHKKNLSDMVVQYSGALEKFEARSRQAGDLDAVLKLQAERTRFDEQKNWDSRHMENLPVILHKVYESAISYQRGYSNKRGKEMTTLNSAYASQVSGLIKRFTSDGKIDDAIAIKDRYGNKIDGWSQSTRVLFRDAKKGPKANKPPRARPTQDALSRTL